MNIKVLGKKELVIIASVSGFISIGTINIMFSNMPNKPIVETLPKSSTETEVIAQKQQSKENLSNTKDAEKRSTYLPDRESDKTNPSIQNDGNDEGYTGIFEGGTQIYNKGQWDQYNTHIERQNNPTCINGSICRDNYGTVNNDFRNLR